jgi:hypothetical protein
VREVDLPIGITFGTRNQAEVHIYADAQGMPGAELWKHKVILEQTLGECCNIAAIHLKAPLQLTAGTQYWLGLTALPNEPDVLGFWNLDVVDQVSPALQATNRGDGWAACKQAPTAAFGIYGK